MSYLRSFWIGTFLLVALPALIAHYLYVDFDLLTAEGSLLVEAIGAGAFLVVMTFLMAKCFLPGRPAPAIIALTMAVSAVLIYVASFRSQYGHIGGFLIWASFLLLCWKSDSDRSAKARQS